MQKNLSGVIIPMITPFNNDHDIDRNSLDKMLNYYLEAGCIPFILGTTGEAVSMAMRVKSTLLAETVKIVQKRAPVFVGISDTCLEYVLDFAHTCKEAEVDALVVHLPAYYPLTEHQVLNYFQNLADAVPLPLIVYNIPATTKISIPVSVVEKLSEHPNIIGLKDSERSLDRMQALCDKFAKRTDFLLYSGWTTQSLHALNIGFDGIVPSTGNIIPKMFKEMVLAFKNGDKNKAEELQQKINPVAEYHQKDKILSDVISLLKVMMKKTGLCDSNVLPPLQKYPEHLVSKVHNDMKKYGL